MAEETRRSDGGVHVSVVLPVHGDVEAVGPRLRQLRSWLGDVPWRGEVVVVDDGSGGPVAELTSRWRSEFDALSVARHAQPRGRGAAARTGALVAAGAHVILAEPGSPAPMESVSTLLEHLESGADVAVASRRLPGSSPEAARPFLERAADTAFHALSRLMAPAGVRDGGCGLVGLRRSSARWIAQRAQVEGDAWEVEWLAIAQRLGLQVLECAVPWRSVTRALAGTSFVRLREVWRVRRRLEQQGCSSPIASQALLSDTHFVHFDREALLASRDEDARG